MEVDGEGEGREDERKNGDGDEQEDLDRRTGMEMGRGGKRTEKEMRDLKEEEGSRGQKEIEKRWEGNRL